MADIVLHRGWTGDETPQLTIRAHRPRTQRIGPESVSRYVHVCRANAREVGDVLRQLRNGRDRMLATLKRLGFGPDGWEAAIPQGQVSLPDGVIYQCNIYDTYEVLLWREEE